MCADFREIAQQPFARQIDDPLSGIED